MKGRLQSAVEEDKKVRSSKEEEMLCRFLMHLSDPPCHFLHLWLSGVPVPLCHYLTLSVSVVFQAVPIGCGTLDNIVICDLGNPLPAGEMVGMKISLETGVCLSLIHPYVAFFCIYILYMCVSELEGCNAPFKASREVPLMKVCSIERALLC